MATQRAETEEFLVGVELSVSAARNCGVRSRVARTGFASTSYSPIITDPSHSPLQSSDCW